MINKNVINFLKQHKMNKTLSERKIKSATIELLTSCNFKCIHCYNQDLERKILDYNFFKTIVDQLISLGCKHITITGGEPLLHPNFSKIYLYLYEKNIKIDLFTNGFYIDKYIDMLRENKPQKIEISLYGTDNDTYKKICKIENGFDKVYNNILLLKKYDINLKLKTIVMEQNFFEFDEMTSLCNKLNIPFKFDTIILDSKNFTNNQSDNILNDNYFNFMNSVKNLKIDNWKKYPKDNSYNKNIDLLYKCYAGKSSLFITSDGYARICNFAKFSEKDLKTNSVLQAWESFNEFLTVKEDKSSKCYTCKYKYCCSNCPVSSYMKNHTNGKEKLPVEQNCREAKFIYESITKNNSKTINNKTN